MPLELIRNDITLMDVDAVVNAANSRLQQGGGVCGALFARANAQKLQKACDAIGCCPPGQAVITKSYGLPARYIIHAVGPVYQDGRHGEEALLRACYVHSLELAQKHSLSSIAFPLISSGIYGYPRQQALSVAVSAIGQWLMESNTDMQVYLVLFDRNAFDLGSALYAGVSAYIDENYVEEHTCARRNAPQEIMYQLRAEEELAAPLAAPAPARRLEDVLKQTGESFSEMLLRLIDERGLTDPEVYKRANLDRKLFSKIRSNPSYQPGKSTVLALALSLQLNSDQTADLLRRAGYALSPSSKTDLIVEYFILEKIYDIHTVNEALFAFGQKTLGGQ